MLVGRRRTKNLGLPAGVRLIGGNHFWQPTSRKERLERKKKGLKASVPLGPVMDEPTRKKWAVLAGFRDEKPALAGSVAELINLFEAEGIQKKLNGRPRSPKTIDGYKRDLKFWHAKFGSCRYAKTEADALNGTALGKVDIQSYLHDAEHKTQANRRVSCLSSVFAYAIAIAGKTTYNPCIDGVMKNAEPPREREALPWEAEVLLTVSTPLMALMIRFEQITGWREGDVRLLERQQLRANGIKLKQQKRGKRQLWLWTDELRAIITEARTIPRKKLRGGEGIVPTAVFYSGLGLPLSVSGFQDMWGRAKERANRRLAAAPIIDVDMLMPWGKDGQPIALRIDDLHFHDLRAAAGDDAEEQGHDRATFLGDSKEVADRHYARREKKVRPLR